MVDETQPSASDREAASLPAALAVLGARQHTPGRRRQTASPWPGGRRRTAASLPGDGGALAEDLRLGLADRRRAGLAHPAALVAMALDLAGELLLAEVDRVAQVARPVARAQRHALEVEGRLGDLVLGDRRVALLRELDLEVGEVRDLLRAPPEALLHVLAQVVGDRGVATLHLR